MFVHLKQKKTVKLELNYKYLLLGIAILTLLLVSCRQSGWSLIGGVSKNKLRRILVIFNQELSKRTCFHQPKTIFQRRQYEPKYVLSGGLSN